MATINITDFSKKSAGYGQYIVTFKSEKTKKEYSNYTTDSRLIDNTFNSENPKVKDL